MANVRVLLPVFALALALPACDSGNKPSAKQPPASGATPADGGGADDGSVAKAAGDAAQPAETADGGEKVKIVEGAPGGDDRYTLQIEPSTDAKAGEVGTVMVKVVPKGPWHMNLEYPTSLKITAPDALAVTKSEMKKADATLDETHCEFAVEFKPAAAGDHEVTGKIKFAVCKDEACSPVTEEVAFKVAVK
ncbi:MAG: hypothetical protein JKY37_27625 [Nannocystaceae bacterium]|nr:hypothetical protein [Nannocystaceae bacterium]